MNFDKELTNYKNNKSFLNNYNKNYSLNKRYYNPSTKKFITESGYKRLKTLNSNLTTETINNIKFIKDTKTEFVNQLQNYIFTDEDISIAKPREIRLAEYNIKKQSKEVLNVVDKSIEQIKQNDIKYNNTDEFIKKYDEVVVNIPFINNSIDENNQLYIKCYEKYLNNISFLTMKRKDLMVLIKVVSIDSKTNIQTERIIKLSQSILDMENINFTDNINNEIMDSNSPIINLFTKIVSLKLFFVKKTNKYEKRRGAFFKYLHKLNIDLSKFGIYKSVDEFYEKNRFNCFIECLIEYNIDDNIIEEIKKIYSKKSKDSYFSITFKEIELISKQFKLDFIVSYYYNLNNNKEDRTFLKKLLKTDNGYEKVINLNLIDEHFFIEQEVIGISDLYFRNYNILNNEQKNKYNVSRVNSKNGKYYINYNDNVSISSSLLVVRLLQTLNSDKPLLTDLVSILMKNNIDNQKINDNYNDALYFDNLEYDDNCVEEYNFSEKEIKTFNITKKNIFVFDFETTTAFGDDKTIETEDTIIITNPHTAYGGWVKYEGDDSLYQYIYDEKKINMNTTLIEWNEYTSNEIKKMLDWIYHKSKLNKVHNKGIILYAHNANFDTTFILNHIHSISKRYIEKGSNLVLLRGYYKDLSIEIRDTYNQISQKLSNIPKMLDIDSYKDIIPYKFYNNKEYIVNPIQNIDVIVNFLILEGKEQLINKFLFNAIDCMIYSDGLIKINMKDYSLKYCKKDVELLSKCWNKWCELFKSNDTLNLDPNDFYTIPSIADFILKRYGCYDGVYKLSGKPRSFISECIVGGRCMTQQNKKVKVECKEDVLNDFDATSLYPSAMSRLQGFLIGKPKVINGNYLDYNYLKKNSNGFFVEIIINNIGIKRDFPLISIKKDDGTRLFTNDIIGHKVFITDIELEDAIKYQQIEFTIIRGYYFNEGFNSKVRELIGGDNGLFKLRDKYKKEKNKIETLFKLIMNSSYGKSIIKPYNTNYIWFDNEEDMYKYVSNNYNNFLEINHIKHLNKWKVKEFSPIELHKNFVQVGTMILAMSKRIMNEVMTTAEDNGINIYYQDTDSMHINNNDIEKLEKAFRLQYNRELIGKSLGQFHSDFEIKDCKNVVSVGAYFVGKKCYIDKLRGINNNNEEVFDYHIRMKGVSSNSIVNESKSLNINVMQLYEKLFNSNEITFELVDDCGVKMKRTDYSINNMVSFKRTLKFEDINQPLIYVI
jgi:hypothetical protein